MKEEFYINGQKQRVKIRGRNVDGLCRVHRCDMLDIEL